MTRVTCPYCFQIHDFNFSFECANSGLEVPARYVRDYQAVAPLWLMTIGYSGHGKTSYLATLTNALEGLSTLYDGMWYRPLDEHTLRSVRQMRDEVKMGKAAQGTPVEWIRPLIFHVHGIPGFDSRCLLLYDVAGQSYDSFGAAAKHAKAIKQVNTAWFLVSLQDLNSSGGGRTLTDLFTTYLAGIEQLRVDIDGWNLIVVYTKADQEFFTRDVKDYLQADPYDDCALAGIPDRERERPPFEEYVREMEGVSQQLETYTKTSVRGGAAFVNMVRASGMNLVFSLCSSLGQSPDAQRGHLKQPASPHRVLDPFLWSLNLEARQSTRRLVLVLDRPVLQASEGSSLAGLADRLWELLAEHGETTTFQLGHTQPIAGAGQRPTSAAVEGVPSVPVLAPIVDRLDDDAQVLLITAGDVLDIGDLLGTPWEDRVVWVVPGKPAPEIWPGALDGRGGEQVQSAWIEKVMSTPNSRARGGNGS